MAGEIRIYFEGHKALRPGFLAFFVELRTFAAARRCTFELIAGKSGDNACRDFDRAWRSHPDAWNILLRDCEGPIAPNSSRDLCRKYGWDQSRASSIFWMVEMMEAWFHADKDTVATFYGRGFQIGALRRNRNVEEIPKKDLEDGLKEATRMTQKGPYYENKASHSSQLLARIRPALVCEAAPNCRMLFEAVRRQLQ